MKLEQILQLEVGCLNFGSVRDSAINPTYPTMLFWVGTVGKNVKVDQYILDKFLPRYLPHLVRFAMPDRSVGN